MFAKEIARTALKHAEIQLMAFQSQNQSRDSQKGFGDNHVTKRAIMALENQSATRDSHMGFGEKPAVQMYTCFLHMSSLAQVLLIQPGPSPKSFIPQLASCPGSATVPAV